MALINTLRDLRFEMKMEQNDFAKFLGVDPSVYNRWEKNKQQPGLEWAIRISNKTDRPIQYFIKLNDGEVNNIDEVVNKTD